MSRLRLHSYWRSSAAYRVRIALHLKGLDFDTVPVHLMRNGGEQFSPVYRALNPQARVPTLVTPGGVLTQSTAILEWLEEAHPKPALLPGTASERARVRAMAQLIAADIQPLQNVAVLRYLQETLHLDDAGVKTWCREWIGRGLGAFEELLAREPGHDSGGGDFCFGATPTLADVCLIPQCASSRRLGVDLGAYPRIARIEQACNALPAFHAAAPDQQPDAAA